MGKRYGKTVDWLGKNLNGFGAPGCSRIVEMAYEE